jgi:uncharacterized protein (DUF2235 family)
VCADGTWNTSDQQDDGQPVPTNVVKIQRAIRAVSTNGTTQVAYYHPGVGTGGLLDRVAGGVTGDGLDRNILECYEFLVSNYVPGDELYFFGFSRGAYTVRSLAGLIRNSGILKPVYASMAKEAFSLYRDRDPAKHPNGEAATAFRKAFSYETEILCVGVWDTVGALGIPLGVFKDFSEQQYSFHDVSLSSHVKNAFHALAIDERRKPFAPTLWTQDKADADGHLNWLEQAWFAGVHSNVGGGYPDSGLSDVAFAWMVARVRSRSSLEFDDSYIAGHLKPSSIGKLYDSMNPVYAALGPNLRGIDAAAALNPPPDCYTWEYVHSSVRDRLTQTGVRPPSYAPENLASYTKRTSPAAFFGDALPRT